MDFRPSFSRTCGEEDYGSWELTDLQVQRGGLAGLSSPKGPAQIPDCPETPPLGAWAALGSVTLGGTGPQAPSHPRNGLCLGFRAAPTVGGRPRPCALSTQLLLQHQQYCPLPREGTGTRGGLPCGSGPAALPEGWWGGCDCRTGTLHLVLPRRLFRGRWLRTRCVTPGDLWAGARPSFCRGSGGPGARGTYRGPVSSSRVPSSRDGA